MLAAVMLARNCEDTLPRALCSIAGHVDKAIAVMAGESADNTEDVLRARGVSYIKAEWYDNFAESRNQLFAFAKLQGVDWSLLLDADDIVRGGSELRQAIERLEAEGHTAGYIQILFGSLRYYQKRIFDLKAPGKWVGRVHETYANEGTTGKTGLEIQHERGNKAVHDKDRNLKIFRRWLEEAPQEFDAHTFYNYGNELLWHEQWEEATRMYGRALGLPQWNDETYFSHIRRGSCYMQLRDWQQAWEEFCAAAQVYPEWQDAYLYMGRWFYYRKMYALCIHMSAFADTKNPPETIMPVSQTEHKNQLWFVAKAKEALAAE